MQAPYSWEKMGILFSPMDHERPHWMYEFAQAPSVLVFDDFIRVYFSCRPKPDKNGQYVSYSGFVDLDRKNITHVLRISSNPVLPLGSLGTFDEFGTYPFSAIKDGDLVRAYYGGWTRCESVPFNVAIGYAESKDGGRSFSRVGPGPVFSYTPVEPFVISGPKIRRFQGKWCLWYIAGRKWILDNGKPEPIYKIRVAFSDDGFSWVRHNADLIDSRIEEDEAQASPDVIFANGKYHMFFCYRRSRNYRGKENGYRIGYAVSLNMIDWERKDELVGISVSDKGWDSEMVSYPHVFELDGNIYMLYLGNQVGKQGFGLARLVGQLN